MFFSCSMLPLFSERTEPLEFVNYETAHGSPMALTPNGNTLLAVNTAANALMVFDVTGDVPVQTATIQVGLEPVTVRARSNNEAWVVNHVSDSISIVNLSLGLVVDTLFTADEPYDVVFAGSPRRAFVTASQANLLQVFRLDDLSAVPTNVRLQGEDPRALAVSLDGSKVYAAFFESGSGTTIVPGGKRTEGEARIGDAVDDPRGPWQGAPLPPNDGNQFNPPLNPDFRLEDLEAVSRIVKKDAAGRWRDENGGDWTRFLSGDLAETTNRVPGWDLPDNDVAIIDTENLAVKYQKRLMTTQMAMAVNPLSGDVTVVGTEADNHVRFEPVLNGKFVKVVMGGFGADGVAVGDLNPHLDYSTASVARSIREQSLGDPRGIAWDSSGLRAFVTGMGSNNVIIVGEDGARLGLIEVGEGPTGIVLQEADNRGFVLNKFEGSISVVDLASAGEVTRVPFSDPTPAVVKKGRRFLYDTHLTSGLGQASCASCHVDGRTDRLAWDLGNPSGEVIERRIDGVTRTFHPLKGPFKTQSLVNIIGEKAMHHSGDKDDLFGFQAAFQNLQGAETVPTLEEMRALEEFLDTIHAYPNPHRNIDNSLSRQVKMPTPDGSEVFADAVAGRTGFDNGCAGCHQGPRARTGITGEGDLFIQPVPLIAESFLSMYDRTGLWQRNATGSTSGFGFRPDATHGTEFFHRTREGGEHGEGTQRLAAYMYSLDGPQADVFGFARDSHAGVGQQVTLNGNAEREARAGELIAIANTGGIELVAHGIFEGVPQSLLFKGGESFERVGGELLAWSELREAAARSNPITMTLVSRGSAKRMAWDPDGDGLSSLAEQKLGRDGFWGADLAFDFITGDEGWTARDGDAALRAGGEGLLDFVANGPNPVIERSGLRLAGETIKELTVRYRSESEDPIALSWRVDHLPDLFGYWRFEETEGNQARDESGRGQEGLTFGGEDVWFDDPERGRVFRAGNGNYAKLGYLPALVASTDFSWSVWVKSDETGEDNIILGNRLDAAGNSSNPLSFLKFTSRGFEWYGRGSEQNLKDGPFAMPTNRWTHQLVVKNGPELQFFRDGSLVGQRSLNEYPTDIQPLFLGGQQKGEGIRENFEGLIDEVALFSKALSVTEVREVYQRGLANVALNEFGPIASSTAVAVDNGFQEATFRLDNLATWRGETVTALKVSLPGGDAVQTSVDWIQADGSSVAPETSLAYGGQATALPGRIEAENFDIGGAGVSYFDQDSDNLGLVFTDLNYRDTGVDIEPSFDSGNSPSLGWVEEGEWVQYTVAVTAGTYDLALRAASALSNPGAARILLNGSELGTVPIAGTGDWYQWEDFVLPGIEIETTGEAVMRVEFVSGAGFNLNWFEFRDENGGVTPPVATGNPFGGIAVSLPGRIEAENFDEGGSGFSYQDAESENFGLTYLGLDYRSSGVDIEPSFDTGNTPSVGWTEDDEWLAYTIALNPGRYDLVMRAATPVELPGGLRVTLDGVELGTLQAANTGDWYAWQDFTLPGIEILDRGDALLRIEFVNGAGFNLNWLEFRLEGDPGTVDPPVAGQQPFGGVPWSVPGLIEAEDYDEGGQGIAYNDAEEANLGGAYRSGGVDIERIADPSAGFGVGWFDDGQWMEYTLDAAAGSYNLELRVSSAEEVVGDVRILLDGEELGIINVTSTGSWSKWVTLPLAVTIPNSGEQVLRLEMIGNAVNLNWIRISSVAAEVTAPQAIELEDAQDLQAFGRSVFIPGETLARMEFDFQTPFFDAENYFCRTVLVVAGGRFGGGDYWVDGLHYRMRGSVDMVNWNEEVALVPSPTSLPAPPEGYRYLTYRLMNRSAPRGFLKHSVDNE